MASAPQGGRPAAGIYLPAFIPHSLTGCALDPLCGCRGAASVRGAPPEAVTPSGVGVTCAAHRASRPSCPGREWLAVPIGGHRARLPWADGQRAAFTHSGHSCFLAPAGRPFWGSRPGCSSQPPCSGLSALLTAVTQPSAAPNWLCALEPTA